MSSLPFKEICGRGHQRRDNLNSRGDCLTCIQIRGQLRYASKREEIFAKRPLCKNGHVRKDNLDGSGKCKTCKLEFTSEQRQQLRISKFYDMKNERGEFFSLEDYNIAFQNQNGKCKICSRHQSQMKRRLHTDHSHITSKFRGLLCSSCNVALGHIKDRVDLLENMIQYLKGEK